MKSVILELLASVPNIFGAIFQRASVYKQHLLPGLGFVVRFRKYYSMSVQKNYKTYIRRRIKKL